MAAAVVKSLCAQSDQRAAIDHRVDLFNLFVLDRDAARCPIRRLFRALELRPQIGLSVDENIATPGSTPAALAKAISLRVRIRNSQRQVIAAVGDCGGRSDTCPPGVRPSPRFILVPFGANPKSTSYSRRTCSLMQKIQFARSLVDDQARSPRAHCKSKFSGWQRHKPKGSALP